MFASELSELIGPRWTLRNLYLVSKKVGISSSSKSVDLAMPAHISGIWKERNQKYQLQPSLWAGSGVGQ
tara:strand:+ start:3610 stop:3816 length:207 start_codon:yes stop_codon:yes gene_type:complete